VGFNRHSLFFCHMCANAACFIATTFVPATQEVRLRYYIDEGLTSVPQFCPPTTASAFSVSSRVKCSGAVAAVPDPGSIYLGSGCPAPVPTVDIETATSICTLCAARFDADTQGCEEYEATSEGLGRDTRNFFPCRTIAAFLFLGAFSSLTCSDAESFPSL